MEWRVDRRKGVRQRVKGGVFASLWPHVSVVGRILDVSREGLSFWYLGSEESTTDSFSLMISSNDGTVEDRELPVETVWDEPRPNDFACGRICRRCCGVKFRKLSPEQEAAIGHLVDTYSEQKNDPIGSHLPPSAPSRRVDGSATNGRIGATSLIATC
jgi:hypothetical protein